MPYANKLDRQKWRRKNKEMRAAYAKQWARKHKTKSQRYMQKWREAHVEHIQQYRIHHRRRDRRYARLYFKAHRQQMKEKLQTWRRRNPAKWKTQYHRYYQKGGRERAKTYYHKNPTKYREARRKFVQRHKEELRQKQLREISDLSDRYVKQLLLDSRGRLANGQRRKRGKLRAQDIPKELIELKRAHMKVRRICREQKISTN